MVYFQEGERVSDGDANAAVAIGDIGEVAEGKGWVVGREFVVLGGDFHRAKFFV